MDVPIYLQWLHQQLRQRGVSMRRARLQHINDAFDSQFSADHAHPPLAVVNCSGLLSRQRG